MIKILYKIKSVTESRQYGKMDQSPRCHNGQSSRVTYLNKKFFCFNAQAIFCFVKKSKIEIFHLEFQVGCVVAYEPLN